MQNTNLFDENDTSSVPRRCTHTHTQRIDRNGTEAQKRKIFFFFFTSSSIILCALSLHKSYYIQCCFFDSFVFALPVSFVSCCAHTEHTEHTYSNYTFFGIHYNLLFILVLLLVCEFMHVLVTRCCAVLVHTICPSMFCQTKTNATDESTNEQANKWTQTKYTAENLFLTILSLQLLLVPLFFPSSSFLILSLSPYPSSSIAFAHPDEPNVAIVAHREQKTNFGKRGNSCVPSANAW